jgi:hypothetical protein
MAQQDKNNNTPSSKGKLKSSKVDDAISRTKTMTGSKPDEININPIQELNQAFKEKVAEARKDPWDKIVKAVPKLKGHQERVDKLKDEMKKIASGKVEEETMQMAASIKEAFADFNTAFKEMLEDALDMEGFIEEDFEPTGMELYEDWGEPLEEAEKSGRRVKLGKPFLTPGGPKKRAVYVKNEKGSVVKVNFGDPNMTIKKSDPERRRSFRARHNCENPGPRTKARYWSCKAW